MEDRFRMTKENHAEIAEEARMPHKLEAAAADAVQRKLDAAAAETVQRKLDAVAAKYARNRRGVPKGGDADLQVRLYSGKLGLDYRYSSTPQPRPYHIASVGKLFTAVLTGMLIESGKLDWSSKLNTFFDPSELDGLFRYEGINYADQVTVEQLLGHTSGVSDYFEGPVKSGAPLIEQFMREPNRVWTPQELLLTARENLEPVAPPGIRYRYSDTGYVLLGLLIERAAGASFESLLHNRIFQPLGMRDSCMLYRSEPAGGPLRSLAPIWHKGVDVSGYASLSCDWAGGGIVSTADDLLAFSRALRSSKLLQPGTLRHMDSFDRKFRPGLHYGLGMMEVRFEQFFFLLRGYPRYRGHIGILATHLFCDPDSDTHIVLNFGSTAAMAQSFRALTAITDIVRKAGGFR